MACLSVLPSLRWAPYAAITFQRAPPEVNGLGVITETPGLTRSAHVLMCLGLPLRTTKTTTESVTMPRYAFLFQLGATRPALTRESTSGASERLTTSAGRPAATARACEPDAPKDCENETPWPADVAWNAGTRAA